MEEITFECYGTKENEYVEPYLIASKKVELVLENGYYITKEHVKVKINNKMAVQEIRIKDYVAEHYYSNFPSGGYIVIKGFKIDKLDYDLYFKE